MFLNIYIYTLIFLFENIPVSVYYVRITSSINALHEHVMETHRRRRPLLFRADRERVVVAAITQVPYSGPKCNQGRVTRTQHSLGATRFAFTNDSFRW